MPAQMLKLAAFALPLLLTGASAALAEDEPKCNPEGTQMEMNICAGDEFADADAELNSVYKKALANAKEQDDSLSDQPDLQGAVKALKKAQRAWIDYRDGHCDGYGFGARGGSMEPMLISNCQTELTRQRIQSLKELMASPEDAPEDGK